jgi:hypothetical protein
MDVLEGDVELTEFETIEVESIKGVHQGANGFPVLMMKALPLAKGTRDCECGKSYDEDTKAANCEDCGKKLPMPAKKASEPECKTCKDTGKIMDGNRDCPDCDAKPSAKSILVKAVTDGQIDEGPDISLGQQIMKLLAQAIQNEAQEIEAGLYGETCDVDLLNSAAGLISMWIGREASPGDDDDSMPGMVMAGAMKAATMGIIPLGQAAKLITDMGELVKADLSGKAINDLPDSAFAHIEPGGTKDEEGKPKVAAAQKKFGSNSGASKGAVAEGEDSVQDDAQGTGGLSKAVEDALTKALEPLRADLAGLQAFKAKVEATPVPGGPVTAVARQTRTEDRTDWAAKAAQYRATADQISDPETREGYLQKAREFDAKALNQG